MQVTQGVAEGWPYVEWVTALPTSKTVYEREENKKFKTVIVFGVFAASLAYFGGLNLGAAIFAGLFVMAGALGGGNMFAGMPLPGGGGTLSPAPPPSEHKLKWEAVAKVTPVMTGHKGRAIIKKIMVSGGEPMLVLSNTLWFMEDGKFADPVTTMTPLTSILEISLGTYDEWHGSIATQHARAAAHAPQSYVIVAVTSDQGVRTLAHSGESKASIADLHARLLSTFINNRPALLAKSAKEEEARKSVPS